MEQRYIRNFCIIAHIDHGKSTLADRLLEDTNTIAKRDMSEQVLDQMDLERERGITIKAKAVRMNYRASDAVDYELNLIDTPGHVDFAYEVSRALAACEGALLVVDATQGIQAQTIANVYMAMEHNLVLIPVVNKIDLPGAEPERVMQELQDVLGFEQKDMICASAKEGIGIKEILEAIVTRVPPPSGNPNAPFRALIFDSKYDSYKGAIAYARVIHGSASMTQKLYLMATQKAIEPLEIGVFKPGLVPTGTLQTGEVGYIATGLKTVVECRVGDTITLEDHPAAEPLPGYKAMKPMVFAGLFPAEGEDFLLLREALDKLKLSDAALLFEPENSPALGYGFRCGFLGLLHMDIVQERLEREYGLNLLATAPSVAFQVVMNDGSVVAVNRPSDLPNPAEFHEVREPWLDVTVITPSRFIGAIMDLASGRRGEYKKMEYLDARTKELQPGQQASEPSKDPRVLLEYKLPLSEVLIEFYDQLKSRTQGYASMDYTLSEYRPGDLVRLDILVNEKLVDALSIILHRSVSQAQGRALVTKLRQLIPRQLFEVPLQAAIGGKVIARENIAAMRKNVLAKCYGGDITRKMKLLHKQAEGKKRMKRIGQVEIPQEAFLALLKMGK